MHQNTRNELSTRWQNCNLKSEDLDTAACACARDRAAQVQQNDDTEITLCMEFSFILICIVI